MTSTGSISLIWRTSLRNEHRRTNTAVPPRAFVRNLKKFFLFKLSLFILFVEWHLLVVELDY